MSLEIPETPHSDKKWSSSRQELSKMKPASMNETTLGDFLTSPKSEFTISSSTNNNYNNGFLKVMPRGQKELPYKNERNKRDEQNENTNVKIKVVPKE